MKLFLIHHAGVITFTDAQHLSAHEMILILAPSKEHPKVKEAVTWYAELAQVEENEVLISETGPGLSLDN